MQEPSDHVRIAAALAGIFEISTDAAYEIVDAPPVRDRIIHAEFVKRRRRGEKAAVVIYDVMERYGVSYSTANHLCYGRNLKTPEA